MPTIKETLLKYIEELPENATLDGVEYFVYIRRKIEQGREAMRRGDFFTQEQVEQRMKEWKEKLLSHSLPDLSAKD